MLSSPSQAEVRKLIETAFSLSGAATSEMYPGESNEESSEYWNVRKYLEHRSPASINRRSLREEYAGDEKAMLSFLTPTGFAHFLPSFMLAALEKLGDEPEFADAIVYYLTPNESLPERSLERLRQFDSRQAQAIATWLAFVDNAGKELTSYKLSAADALDRHWRNYLR